MSLLHNNNNANNNSGPRREGIVTKRHISPNSSESASGIDGAGGGPYKVTEEVRYTRKRSNVSGFSLSGMIIFCIQLVLTIVQTKVVPVTNFLLSFAPMKVVRGWMFDMVLSLTIWAPLNMLRCVIVNLGMVPPIAQWLEIETDVKIVANNEEVQNEMDKMRIYIRDKDDLLNRVSTQKDFQKADSDTIIVKLEKECKISKENLRDLDQNCRDLHSQLSATKNDTANLKKRLGDAESSLKRSETFLATAQEENRINQRLARENEALQKKMKDATEEWNRAAVDVKMLRNEITLRDATIHASSVELLNLKNEVLNIQEIAKRDSMQMMKVMEERSAVEKAQEQAMGEMRMTMDQLKQGWESEMIQLKERFDHAEKEVIRVMEDMRVVQAQREEAQHNAREMSLERDGLRRDVEDMRGNLERTRQELNEALGKADGTRRELEEIRNGMQGEISTLQQQLAQVRGELEGKNIIINDLLAR